MNPQLVHSILLAGPSDFESLRTSTRRKLPSFPDYVEAVFNRETQNPGFVLKRAYHNSVLEGIQEKKIGKRFEAIWGMLLDLHKLIRSLVPNRSDLHSLLIDERQLPENDVTGMSSWVREAAEALAQLESPEQATTTREWIQQYSSASTNTPMITSPESFVILSLQYLSDKASICQEEKDDFYLTQMVAPKLYNSGEALSMERQLFEKKYGQNPPITRSWIASLISSSSTEHKESLRTNNLARRDLITRGWIQHILFEKSRQTVVPEIFVLDIESINAIRSTARSAAAGCALGLLACQTALRDPDILLTEESKGIPLVKALDNQSGHASIPAYEQSVEDTVVAIARSWSDAPIVENDRLETLRGRTRSVLRGEDPVLKLLDERMQGLFCDVGVDGEEEVPVESMRTGRWPASNSPKGSPFIAKAQRRFADRGLAFYAKKLARAANLATKVSRLAYSVYGDQFLDQMIFDELGSE